LASEFDNLADMIFTAPAIFLYKSTKVLNELYLLIPTLTSIENFTNLIKIIFLNKINIKKIGKYQ
jgi:hypothetical protein